ncbi:replication-relaxation family protein [Streptomyces sp. NPDC026672]
MRGPRRPSRTMSDPTAVRLKAGHTLTETALAFLEDARRRGDVCRPLDWIPEVHHPVGSGEAVIPDALLYYQEGPADGEGGPMLRAFVEVDRATMGPERLAAKLPAHERLYHYVPTVPGRRRPTLQEPAEEGMAATPPALPAAESLPGSRVRSTYFQSVSGASGPPRTTAGRRTEPAQRSAATAPLRQAISLFSAG